MAKLSKDDIREIIKAFQHGEPKLRIAERFHVDNATIHYHIGKYESAYVFDGDIYSVIKYEAQHECLHPSTKCSCCGKLFDTIRREERAIIATLQAELTSAKQTLSRLGVESPTVQYDG